MSELQTQTAHFWIPAEVTDNGVVVKLYTDHPGVDWPVVKLFDKDLDDPSEELTKIPDFLLKEIQTEGIGAGTGDVKFSRAQAAGVLHPILPALDFLVYIRDGKTTKRVAWPETTEIWGGAGGPAGEASGASGVRAYVGLTDSDKEVLALVAEEVRDMGRAALLMTNDLAAQSSATGVSTDEVFKTVFYQMSRTFKDVRGAATVPAGKAITELGAINFEPILNGDISTFAEDIADGHFAIVSADAARKMISQLGIKITEAHKESPELRADVAKRVWLYAELTTRWGEKIPDAVNYVMRDAIPW